MRRADGNTARVRAGTRTRAWLAVAAVGALGAGCSSPAASHSSTTTTKARHHVAPATSTTTTTTTSPGSTTTAPPVQSSEVQVQISGPSATLTFTSADISGSLSPQTGSFSQGGTIYTFVVSGVHYTGAPSTTTTTGGLIKTVAVASSAGGASVTVTLSSSASHASYGLGHNEVGVKFS
ncbi:MAG: hypothetical protein ACRDYB_04965 [Acidimicrobiales bacterium]